MVYSTCMNIKKLVILISVVLISFFSFSSIYAAQPSLTFYPSSGVVSDIKNGFTVDVLIDSAGYDVSKARVVVKFDPNVVKLRKAYRNTSLFEEWPTDGSSTDNVNGIVMLTGQAKTEGGKMYKTENSADILARLEFDVIATKKQDIVLEFQYSGLDEILQSVIIDSVTSTNVLAEKPSHAVFSLDVTEKVPKTGISTNTFGIIGGVLLILFGGFVKSSSVRIFAKKRGTIVISD